MSNRTGHSFSQRTAASFLLAALAAFLFPSPLLRADSSPLRVPPSLSKATLHWSHGAIAPGESIEAGIRIVMEKGVKTYGDPPGDGGMPPNVEWTLPAGLTAGTLQLPPAKSFRQPVGTVLGYEGEVLFRVKLTAAKDAPIGGRLKGKLEAEWLVCTTDICMPQSGVFEFDLPVQRKLPPRNRTWDALRRSGGWENISRERK